MLTAVLIVSAYGDAPPPLAEETGDVQARAESGEELSGVRPYTLETEDGDEEYVYVLQLEGKPGFKQARKRWGFHANPMSHPPFVHPQEIDVLERAGGLVSWVEKVPGARYYPSDENVNSLADRTVQLAAEGVGKGGQMLALRAGGVSWAALGLPAMLAANSQDVTAPRTLNETGLEQLEKAKGVKCSGLGAGEARDCRSELTRKAARYAGNVPVSSDLVGDWI